MKVDIYNKDKHLAKINITNENTSTKVNEKGLQKCSLINVQFNTTQISTQHQQTGAIFLKA